MARLLERYREEIVPQMMERFSIDNVNAVPVIDKVSVNMGVGLATENRRRLEAAMEDLGVSRVGIAPPAFDPDGVRRGLNAFADEVLSKLR